MATKKQYMPITTRRRKGCVGPKLVENRYRYEDEPNVPPKKKKVHKKKVTRVRHKFKKGEGHGSNKY